jgi:hypothetical protein
LYHVGPSSPRQATFKLGVNQDAPQAALYLCLIEYVAYLSSALDLSRLTQKAKGCDERGIDMLRLITGIAVMHDPRTEHMAAGAAATIQWDGN